MWEFAKSGVSLSWAMTLLGAKQFTEVFARPTEATRRATETFAASTQSAGEQLDDMMRAVFLAGDDIQREFTDMMSALFSLEALDPRSEAAADMRLRLMETFASLNPGQDGRLTLRELRNKLEVFQLVYRVRSLLDLPAASEHRQLVEPLERAYDLEPYPTLWAVEGLGHYHGDTYWDRNEEPRSILSVEQSGDLPDKSLTMLHAGVGMAIAQGCMKSVNHLSPIAEIRQAIRRTIDLCRENSRPGYEGATLESLGLITRNGQFYGETRPVEMVLIVARELAEMDPEAYDLFWHGVGRATYFLPINFVPGYGSIWHAVEIVRREATDERARLNALSGLAWGVTMVNIRHPEILTIMLKRLGKDESDHAAFSNGVASAIIMRSDTTPDAPFIRPFFQFKPEDAAVLDGWDEHVRRPCEKAVDLWRPALAARSRLGEIFRYHPSLDELANGSAN